MALLKTLIIQLIKNEPLESVFEEEQILVQSSGISQWLKMSIASEIGITANTKFPLPATFLWNMFHLILPSLPKESAFSKEMMKWKMMKILPSVIDSPEFEPIKNYLVNDKNGVKNHQLADKIADLYDQYSVFRPEWIAEWESGTWDHDVIGHHRWQPILWKLLVEYTKALGQSEFHRANMYESFIEKVSSGDFDKSALPKRLFVVGISSLPPRFLDALQALSRHAEIHLMFTNPCRFYWGDIKDEKYLAQSEAKKRKKFIIEHAKATDAGESHQLTSGINHELFVGEDTTIGASVGHPLLASMGKMGRDYLSLLSEKEADEIDAFIDIKRDSLLHHVQADILNLDDKSQSVSFDSNEGKGMIFGNDRSITLHGCFSPHREVEILHDYLLKKFNEDSNLTPQDVVIMVTDIDLYSPHINAVFSGVPKDRYIPYSVSDRTASSQAPVLQVFLDLLSIGIGRQETSKVMEILEVPAVMRKFDIDPDDFSKLSIWIEQSGIRWGLDEETARSNNLPAPKQNHWLFGLNRMILGYAIPQEKGEFQDILPYNECQGSAAELAGKLGVLIDALIALRNELSQPHTIQGWIDVINSLLDTFFDVTREEEDAIANIRATLSTLYHVVQSAQYTDDIATEIIIRHFNSIFSKDRLSQHLMIGKVTFCTLMSMRSIPFKLVCLLGMNDALYPRACQPEGFDLMAANPRIGDRSRRHDDRYLFLEAILAAQESLYISYVAKNIQDNTDKAPSVLVSELLEYLQKSYCFEDNFQDDAEQAERALVDTIYCQHPLSPFSPSAFQGEYQSFAAEWVPASMASVAKKEKAADVFLSKPLENILVNVSGHDAQIRLDISELLRFWSLPVKHFFARRLNVNFDLQHHFTRDEESFDLDAREAFPVKRQWLDALVNQTDIESGDGKGCQSFLLNDMSLNNISLNDMVKQFSLAGVLPHGGFGYNCLSDIRESIASVAKQVRGLTASGLLEQKIDLCFELDGLTIHLDGWARRLFAHGSVYYRAGTLRPQDILQAWIQHLAVAASGIQKPTYILCISDQIMIEPLGIAEAKEYLRNLVHGYYQGMCSPIPFLPRCCYAALKAIQDKKTGLFCGSFQENKDKITSAIEQAFTGGYNAFSGEISNPYISRVWTEVNDDFAESVFHAALTYLYPAMTRIKAIE
ncbi:exodeoxyribonuclease V subunit gamma [Photobacterium galatheae]|nr:exodeoxyribonuclease V subunit gamma [Photobacterium galatheae]